MKTVGIIGGSGFIGSYITKKFLEEGYHVKATVTAIRKSEKYKHLFKLKNADNLSIIPLKIEDLDLLRDFVYDCEVVIHSGTPFRLELLDAQKELFEPTLKGTENFLQAILQTPHIKKVVLIASVAAWNTNFPLPAGGKGILDTYDEQDLKFTSEESRPYARAKFLANQLVEEFIAKNQEPACEIISVSPVMVMGKSLSKREDSTSTGIQFLFKNRLAPDAFIQMFYDEDIPMAVVDVEDVANAVYQTAIIPGLHGKNYLLSSETYSVSDIHEMLNHRHSKNSPQIVYKNNLAKADLGAQFRPVKETLYNY